MRDLHTLAWVAWVMLVMTVGLIANNPYYLAIVFLSVILVALLAPRTGSSVASFRALLLFGTGLFVVSIAIAVVNGNYGDHILFTIPGPNLPDWLGGLRVGGPVSGEGLVAASIRGLAILTVLLAFGVFNGAVSPHRVLQTAPAALFHAGLVLTVGLTLLPSTIQDVRRIREMRSLRGARAGARELPALVVPCVINGLERSLRLAEAMEARGYAAAAPGSRRRDLLGAVSVPLLIAAAWGWYYYEEARAISAIAALAGIAALGAWLWVTSRATQTTRLHGERLHPLDRAFAVASLGLIALTVLGAAGGWLDLKYNPFADLPWPQFSPAGASIAVACAWPAIRFVLVPIPAPARPQQDPARSPEAVRT